MRPVRILALMAAASLCAAPAHANDPFKRQFAELDGKTMGLAGATILDHKGNRYHKTKRRRLILTAVTTTVLTTTTVTTAATSGTRR